MEDFRQFRIDAELIKEYTTIYWQYEPEFEIREGMTIDFIQKEITRKETGLKTETEAFRQDYINKVFPEIFPPEQFDVLTRKTVKCAYCGITIPMILELANNQLLNKKNYRGWSLEIDRKDSNREYTPDNCVMACYWCNNAKTDEFTHEEFKEVGKMINKIWADRLSVE
ncbi:MAG: hypothetical protein IPN08_06465 [Bacteroidales bacterium]|nr:hypothetical protein [Bacteroidales bacterium]